MLISTHNEINNFIIMVDWGENMQDAGIEKDFAD